MSDEVKVTQKWGYHRTEEPKVFDLKEGEKLPAGWEDTPAAFEGEEKPAAKAKSAKAKSEAAE